MSVEQMRQRISDAYDGAKWKWRVQSMPDNQVVAVYYNLLKRGKLNKKKKKTRYHQMTIFELMPEEERKKYELRV